VPPCGRRMQRVRCPHPLSGTLSMATRRSASPSKGPAAAPVAPAASTSAALKLRQTQAEYVAARPSGEPSR
jgi:hypothetical protein